MAYLISAGRCELHSLIRLREMIMTYVIHVGCKNSQTKAKKLRKINKLDLPGGGPDGNGFGMLVGLPLFFPKREEDCLLLI